MLAAALLVVVQVASVADVANPRPAGWVTDQAGVLTAADEASLDAIATELATSIHVELAIVTVDKVPGTPKLFATALFNHWGIGSARTNTGVLVLLVMGKRRLEIETGDGIEGALPAEWLADMQKTEMVPKFKRKDFAGGLVAGVKAIAAHLHAAVGESPSTAPPHEYRDDGTVVLPPVGGTAPAVVQPPPETLQSDQQSAGSDGGAPLGALVAGGLGLVGIGGGGALFARHRRKQRTCDTCQPPRRMIELSEIEDDKHLDNGQRTEEQVGSVDYDVVVCPGCQATRTLRRGTWFSGYDRCSGCSYKTMTSTSTTLIHATYDHGGQVQVTETCVHCSHVSTRIRHTAARTRPSTTSSFGSRSSGGGFRSSGGGFGGGRSSGGGAGSSW